MSILGLFALAMGWLLVLGICFGSIAAFERRARLHPVRERARSAFPRAAWGSDRERPPSDSALVRALAFFARLARRSAPVRRESRVLALAARVLSLAALASGLALLPLASGWMDAPPASASFAAQVAQPLVLFSSDAGLALLAFLILVSGLAHTVAGLAEEGEWARLAAVRVVGCALSGTSLLLLVLAPLAIATGSLDLAEMNRAQAGAFPLLGGRVGMLPAWLQPMAEQLRLPNWHVVRQPLTAAIAVPTFALLLSRSFVIDGRGHSPGLAGYGLDADPSLLYWARLEGRVAEVLAAALFVVLFLGGSGLPFEVVARALSAGHAALGSGLPALIFFLFELGVFTAKLLFVLLSVQLLRRTMGSLRIDQHFETVTRRLLPLAWANLLLMAALSLTRLGVEGAA